jgi:hypothetical protein
VIDRLSLRLVPDELWALAQPLIPQFTPRPQGGGTAPVDDRAVLTAIVYVLTRWLRLAGPAAELRGHRAYRASPIHRLDHSGSVAQAGSRGARRVGQPRLDRLVESDPGRRVRYDIDHFRIWLRRRGIIPRIARKGIGSSEKLGRHRWVTERTMCAARRPVVSPAQLRGPWRGVPGSNGLPDAERLRDNSMSANRAAGSSGQGRCAGGTRVIWRNCAARRSVVFPM